MKNNSFFITPTPGIAIIELLDDKKTSSLTLTSKQEGRIRKGKILAIAPYDIVHAGEHIPSHEFGSVGDTVYFMSYYDEGGVDRTVIDNKTYFFVKFGDLRGRVHEQS